MEIINQESARLGQPNVLVNLGIDCGEGITSSDGKSTPVSLWGQPYDSAARLVRLCKKFDTQIIISQSVFEFLSPKEKSEWQLEDDVVVRSNQKQSVAKLKLAPTFNQHRVV